MTQEHFTTLTAMAAVGLAPIMLTTPGHVSPARLKELAEAAANLAQELAKEAQTRYQAASGAI
jgi:membrane-associated HD superfamily phosphohydrolase